jgi:hypothetical protein
MNPVIKIEMEEQGINQTDQALKMLGNFLYMTWKANKLLNYLLARRTCTTFFFNRWKKI